MSVRRDNTNSLFASKERRTHVSWFCCERVSNTDTEEKKLLNKVVIFVFFAHTKWSRRFRKLRLNHWCHMDYFIDVLTTFLGLESGSYVAVYGGSENSWISSKISWFVFRRWMKVFRVGKDIRVSNYSFSRLLKHISWTYASFLRNSKHKSITSNSIPKLPIFRSKWSSPLKTTQSSWKNKLCSQTWHTNSQKHTHYNSFTHWWDKFKTILQIIISVVLPKCFIPQFNVL